MADNALTDEELQAVLQSGNGSLIRRLTDDERARMLQLDRGPKIGAVPANAPVTLGDLRANPSESMRRIGRNLVSDATDPRVLGGLAASYLVPKAVDMVLPAPQGGVPMPSQAPTDAPPGMAQMVGRALFKKATGLDTDAIEKQIATNELRATRMNLQAARSRTRQAAFERQQAEAAVPPTPSAAASAKTPPPLVLTPEQLRLHEQQMANAALLAREQGMKSAAYGSAAWKTPPAAPPRVDVAAPAQMPPEFAPVDAPVAGRQPVANVAASGPLRAQELAEKFGGTATSPAGSASGSPPRATAAGPAPRSAAPPPSSLSPLETLQRAGLSAEEADQAVRWVRQGVDLDQVVKRIDATRALLKEKPALKNLPTLQQALAEVRNR